MTHAESLCGGAVLSVSQPRVHPRTIPLLRQSFHHPPFRTLLLLVILLFFPCNSSSARTPSKQPLAPLAEESLPSLLLPDGAVCLADSAKPSVCAKRLLRIDKKIMKSHSHSFYGLFDLDGDGSPEVFLDYWRPRLKSDTNYITLLVYKKKHGRYRQFLKLKAESMGYAPGAWFLKDKPHPKAIFMTRYGGSSGTGLFYLSLKKKSLELISGKVFMEGLPVFEDLDGDGHMEIFLPGRSRDRTADPGNAILHWNGKGYDLWWPNWVSTPYVMYARLVDLDKDGRKEIVAVLDPGGATRQNHPDEELAGRELGVWKIVDGMPYLISKTELPASGYLAEPYFTCMPCCEDVQDINLSYTLNLQCDFHDGKLVCGDKQDIKPRTADCEDTP